MRDRPSPGQAKAAATRDSTSAQSHESAGNTDCCCSQRTPPAKQMTFSGMRGSRLRPIRM